MIEGGFAEFIAGEWRAAGQEFIEQNTQAVNVRASVDVDAAFGLLGRHVVRRADELAVFGEEGLFCKSLHDGLGDSEVNHLRKRLAILSTDEHIAGFEVSMNHAFVMGVLHGLADLFEEFEPFRNRQSLMVGVFRDRFAFDVFHDEVRSSGVVGVGVKHFRDVWMIHQRQSLPFGFEAGDDQFRVHAQLDEFQRDFATDGCSLFGSIDFAHAAGTDAFQNTIRADGFGDRFEQISGSIDGV